MLSVLVYIYTVVISSHRPKRFSADLAAGHSHSKESFNSPLRLSATPRSHRQSIPLLFGSPVIERNDCWARIAFCRRYLHQPLDPDSHSFQLPVLSQQHLPNRQDEAHRVCYERMVMVCYMLYSLVALKVFMIYGADQPFLWYSVVISIFAIIILSVLGSLYQVRLIPSSLTTIYPFIDID